MRLFANKKVSIVITLCIAVILIMSFWLTTLYVQKTSFIKQVDALLAQMQSNQELIDKYNQDTEYRNTVDYIIDYAEQQGWLKDNQKQWIQSNLNHD
ncbi:MAG: hypothetical protein PHW00_01865 [Clostridia bacterium]|nr:hypothetical protein [Clostridia bacterium]